MSCIYLLALAPGLLYTDQVLLVLENFGFQHYFDKKYPSSVEYCSESEIFKWESEEYGNLWSISDEYITKLHWNSRKCKKLQSLSLWSWYFRTMCYLLISCILVPQSHPAWCLRIWISLGWQWWLPVKLIYLRTICYLLISCIGVPQYQPAWYFRIWIS